MNNVTFIMGLVAAASLAGAVSMRPVDRPPPTFEDTGEALFEGFTDPTVAASLEVREWNDESTELKTFSVVLEEGKWTIPSHHGYPADGTERMAKAAASFIGVNKDIVRSNLATDHEEFGLLDPEDIEADGKGKAKRFTIKDASGTTLVDVFVGKEVPDKQGFRFVRYPDKDRVYAVRIELDVSTEFTDWIEDDLLEFDRDRSTMLVSNSYTVDEETQQVVDNQAILFENAVKEEIGTDKEWRMTADTKVPADKELNPSKVTSLLGAIDRLKIVGVRPRPSALRELADQSMGFFLSRGRTPKLFGNEGELSVVQDDGVVYTFYFGEITHDTGLALTAGGPDKPSDGEAAGGDKSKANRYLLVQIGYAQDSDSKSGSVEATDGADAAAPEAGDAAEAKDADGAETDAGDAEAKKKEPVGLDRAKELQARFDKWFYVISNSSFEQLRKKPDDFWRDVKKD